MKTFVSKECHPVVSEESIDDKWYVGMNNTKHAYKVTTHRGLDQPFYHYLGVIGQIVTLINLH